MTYYVVDAFTDEVFGGNPAGICIPDRPLSDALMQSIAAENNLAETAFLYKENGGYRLRWFTPEVEMDLCGHATLATAFIVMNYIDPAAEHVDFEIKSGRLGVDRDGEFFVMDFPSRKPSPVQTDARLEAALGAKVLSCYMSRDLVVLTDSESSVRTLKPDFGLLAQISRDVSFAVVVTAPGDGCDFVSRFFAPNAGIAEDPVTGSAHSTLIPFWSERLGRKHMLARQLSPRGGTLRCADNGERVSIAGRAALYLKGELFVDGGAV